MMKPREYNERETCLMPHELLDSIFCPTEKQIEKRSVFKSKSTVSYMPSHIYSLIKDKDVSHLDSDLQYFYTLIIEKYSRHLIKQKMGLTQNQFLMVKWNLLKGLGFNYKEPFITKPKTSRIGTKKESSINVHISDEKLMKLSARCRMFYNYIRLGRTHLEIRKAMNVSSRTLSIFKQEIEYIINN